MEALEELPLAGEEGSNLGLQRVHLRLPFPEFALILLHLSPASARLERELDLSFAQHTSTWRSIHGRG